MAGPGHGAPGVLGAGLPRGVVLRDLPEQGRGRGGHAAVLQGVLLPRRHRQPLHAGDARARSTRAASSATACRTPSAPRSTIPDLIVAAVVGDGESETGPLATAWHSNKFLNPIRDGAVLPILHLNGYKINNPTISSRISPRGAREPVPRLRLDAVLRRGRRPGAHAPGDGRHDRGLRRSRSGASRRRRARAARPSRPRWPMIVLRTPKGWTGPKEVDGHKVEGFWRVAPGADGRRAREPGPPEAARRLDAQLQAGGAVRRRAGG